MRHTALYIYVCSMSEQGCVWSMGVGEPSFPVLGHTV